MKSFPHKRLSAYAVHVAAAPAHSSKRILIFGGTFDPPHLAHSKLPAKALQQLECDQILYIPAAINPLKADTPPTAKEHRLAMLLLAIADVPNARISTIELDRQGKSYTIDTLMALHAQFDEREQNGPEFFLLIGSDQALDFHRWKNWPEILTLARPAVMLRPPYNRSLFHKQLKEKYSEVEAEQWLAWTLRLPKMDISASDVRQRVKRHEGLNDLLDPAVEQYIRANKLYQ